MKRIRLVLWIGIVLLLLPTATAAAAQEKAQVTLTAARGEGNEIVLTIGARDVSFNALQLAVAYDPEKLTPRSAEDGSAAANGEEMTEYLAPLYWRNSGWMQCEYGEYSAEKGVVELTVYADTRSKGVEDGSDADGYVSAGAQGMDLVSLHFTLKETAAFAADTIELTTTGSNDHYVILSAKNPEDARTPIVKRGRRVAVRDFTALGISLQETEEPAEPEANEGDSAGSGGSGSGGTGSGGTGSTGGFGSAGTETGTKESETTVQQGQSGTVSQPDGGDSAAALTDMKDHWARTYVEDLVSRGMVSGYPDGTFQPEAQLSRGEFCTVLCKMIGLSPSTGENRFTDLAGAWSAPYVNALSAAEKVSGVGNGRFAPDRAISRQEAAALLSAALELPEAEQTLPFTDAGRIEPWAADAVRRAVKAGLFGGYEDGTLRPEGWIARGEMAAVISHGLARME